ncbi:MAG: UDP-N-acetylmuramate dehydrogenase [bacterium]
MSDIYTGLPKVIQGHVFFDEPLSQHTTIRVGGPAKVLVIPKTTQDLIHCFALAAKEKMPYMVMGNGSNILFSDQGYEGMIIKTKGGLSSISIEGNIVTAGAGVLTAELLNVVEAKGLGGLEFMVGVPATIGGAVSMNLGAFGSQLSDYIVSVKLADNAGEIREESNIAFGYRSADLGGRMVVEVKLKLKNDNTASLRQEKENYLEKRRSAYGMEFPHAGSVFKNPPGLYAGKLLQDAGLKGFRAGNAMFSDKHANVIINLGNASYSDILALIDEGVSRVKKQFGIDLVLELKIVGGAKIGYCCSRG